MGASEIRALKRLYPETPLVAGGHSACVILSAADPAVRRSAETLADDIAAIGGVRPAVLADTAVVSRWLEIDFAALPAPQVIALGNINNNRLLAALWGQGYTAEDDAFPGAGGYVVRTVHDPFARGANVVVLAGSDPAGVQQAVEVFARKYLHREGRGSEVRLPGPIVDVRSDAQRWRKERLATPAEFAATLDRRVRAQVSRAQDETEAAKASVVNLTHVLGQLAEAWFLTGDPGYPPLMKRLVDEHGALLAVIPPRAEMEGATADDMRWWDLVEELPVWTEQDRLKITNAFLKDALQGHEATPAHTLVREGFVQVLTENHGTNSAQHTYDHWRYFAKYYDLPETAYWLSVVRAIFAGQLASHQMTEDSASYLPFSHEDNFTYALASGDMRYFQLGIARTHMEFVLQCCYTNLGTSSGFGDAQFVNFPWGFTAAARIGWMLQDPRVNWWRRDFLAQQCGLDTSTAEIPVDHAIGYVEPKEWTGLSVFPIYRQNLGRETASKVFVTTPAEPAGPEWFNKIVFRDAWSPDAQYLLLDGAGVWHTNTEGPPGPAGHNQDDINTIITFTDKGRLWLVDHTYSERAIQQHSGLTIARDGETNYAARPAKLRDAAQGAGFALTRTTFDDFSGAQWERTIFWRRGDHFVVLDRAIAQQAGDYAVRCAYRALGEPTLHGADLRLEQQGRFFQIRDDGETRRSLDAFPFPGVAEWRKSYRYAEPVAKILEEYKSARLAPGEAIGFANFLKAANHAEELDGTELQHCAANRLLAKSGGESFVYGLATLPGDAGECDAFALAERGLLAAGVRRLGGAQTPLLAADTPIDMTWENGALHLKLATAADVTIAGQVRHLAAGEQHVELTPATTGKFAALLVACRAAAAREAEAYRPAENSDRLLAGAQNFPVQRVALGTPVSWLVAADLDGDGRAEWCVTGAEGLGVYSSDGKLRWRFTPGRPCAALAVADVDGDGKPEIAVGCEDEKVYLLDAAGHVRWSHVCPPTDRTQPPVPDQIEIADLDGDGKKEIVVAANYLHCLTADGRVRWEDFWQYQRGRKVGDVQSFAISDFNHDGRQEIVAAINLNYPVALGYDADGRRVYPADPAKQHNHKFMRVHPPQATLLLDLFADGGGDQIVVAAKDQLNLRWTGGARDALTAGDLSGGRVALAAARPGGARPFLYTATDLGAVLAYRAQGARNEHETIDLRNEWRQTVGDKITALWGGVVRDRPLVAVGASGGAAYVFDGATGAPLAHETTAGDPVRQVLAAGDAILAVHASGLVATMQLSP